MNKAELQKKIESLSDSDEVVFRTKAEDTDFMSNFQKSVIEKEIPARIEEVHSRYDEDLYTLTGKRKPATMKTYNFMKEVVSELKSKAEQAVELQGKIAELQEQVKNGAHDEATKKELQSVKDAYKKLQEDTKNQLTEKEKAFQNFRVGADIDRAIAGFKIKDTIPEAVKNTFLETKRAELLRSAKIEEDGKIVFLDANGLVMKNEATMNPKTINEILKDILLPIVDEGIHQPGGGVDPNKAASGTPAPYIPGANIKIDDLSDDVQKKTGYKRGSPEYQKAFNEGYKILIARK